MIMARACFPQKYLFKVKNFLNIEDTFSSTLKHYVQILRIFNKSVHEEQVSQKNIA